MPETSLLVTVHNRETYLTETLRSVLASTYEDFEVIVVDDASSDGSLPIAEGVAATDDRIRVVANEENLGDYGNRMRAASLARGTFIKYLDSDDLIYPHTLGVMVGAMHRHSDAAAGLAHSLPEDELPYPWRLTPREAYRKHFLGRGCMSCGPSGAIIRRDAFEAIGGFRKEWGVLSDMDLWFRLAARHSLVLMPPGLVWWRRHEGQEFTKKGASADYLCRGYELDELHLSSADCPLSDRETRQAIDRKRQHFSRKTLKLALSGHPLLALRLARRAGISLLELRKGVRAYD